MKKTISLITIFTLVFVMSCSLSGCDDSFGIPTAVAYVLGIHENFPGIRSNAQSIYDPVYDVCLSSGEVSYAVVEGEPTQTKKVQIKAPENDIPSTKRKELAKRNATSILQNFASLTALHPEVDTLQTIGLCADTLASSDCETKRMIVFDSGLCTAGLLSQISKNVLDTDPKIIVDNLESLHALPKLDGVSVTWIGLGYVSGKQQRIPDSYTYKLKALWTMIIERAGGTVEFDTTPVTGEEMQGLPHVSVVEFPADELDLKEINFEETAVIPFPEKTVKFLGDRTEFADPLAAEKAIEPVADYLKANPDKKVLIAGTTAKVGTGDGIELSKARAQTFRQALLSFGVSAEQMECMGLGCSENSLRVDDHNADGSLNPEMAARNRAIYVILSDSKTAKSLKGALA